MFLPVYYVDAFTNKLFSGNPAAVIFSDLNDSDLMQKIFGEKGIHARAAVGVNSLPLGFSVEIEAIFKVAP